MEVTFPQVFVGPQDLLARYTHTQKHAHKYVTERERQRERDRERETDRERERERDHAHTHTHTQHTHTNTQLTICMYIHGPGDLLANKKTSHTIMCVLYILPGTSTAASRTKLH